MFRRVKSIRKLFANLRFQALKESLVELWRRYLALRLADLAAQFVDGGADLFDFGVRELDRVHYRLFFYFFRTGLDHDNRIRGAYDHDVEQSVTHFGVCGIGDEAAFHQADAHGADRAEERNIGEGQGRRSSVNAANIGVIVRVGGEDKGDDLGLALEAFGE